MPLSLFHPAVARWFSSCIGEPTPCQRQAWSAIRSGRHALVAAPTGSGKTLAAFLGAIDDLVRLGVEERLDDRTRVLYVSPLKALGNDIQRNLEGPIEGINRQLAEGLEGSAPIRSMVRTGDTPAAAREAMRKCPPHILVTTPESLFILLASDSGRAMLAGVETVIVDEVHALLGNKRGAHLALSLARLDELAATAPVRIGLSATQKPIDEVARYLVGSARVHDGVADCHIVDGGHTRGRDLAIEVPDSPLEALMSGEVWGEIYDRIATLIEAHRSTIVFVNTRRMAERVARSLSERLGEQHVTSHHGSLARAQRLQAEQRLKAGGLKALVATASLELGIDIGDVDLVCQLGSPHAISLLLQRVGRSGHAVSGTPKGRLFPLSRDDLLECIALLDAVRRDELDCLHVPVAPLDVLAQQLAATCINRALDEQELFDLVRAAWPYRDLSRERFDDVLRMLSEGFSTRRGRRGTYLLRDAVNRRVRARRGARLTVVTNAGAIPDNADYDVVQEPEGIFLGTVNEDFAIESMPGDIFQLGNTSWRMLRVEGGRVRVEDAHGQPPTIPFWFGEAPGRSDELSYAVSRLRETLDERLAQVDGETAALAWLRDEVGIEHPAATQLVEYLAAARAALGELPTHHTLVLERFFDEAGGMQLVLHSPRGSRINRAFGLALRKRFCRSFNFELQAAASEDVIVLSLGETHSFELTEVARFLHPASARDVLVQALLDAPMFTTRWRWNANISLAVPRFRSGTRVPPHIQRMQAEDLVAVVFPDQLACLENITGSREIPEHPLVRQTLHDCLTEAMDVDGLLTLLDDIHAGRVRVVGRDLTAPSPLAEEILTARPYTFLDDAPAEERRTRAVATRRWADPRSAADLGRLEPAAIARVRDEAWPSWADGDELHDTLVLLGFMSAVEADGAEPMLQTLAAAGRALRARPPGLAPLWCATERWPELRACLPGVAPSPTPRVPAEYQREWQADAALVEILRGRLAALGPCTAGELGAPLGIDAQHTLTALLTLEGEGYVLRGNFSGSERDGETEWCERRLLARIHRQTMDGLRRQIEPVERADFLRFLCDWQQLSGANRVRGSDGLVSVLTRLDGFEAPAVAWEQSLLPARVADYEPGWLDASCLSGRFGWLRLSPPAEGAHPPAPLRSTPIAIVARGARPLWLALARGGGKTPNAPVADSPAARVLRALQTGGACFPDEIAAASGLALEDVATALATLGATGLVSADGFGALRALISRRRRERALEDGGRWALLPAAAMEADAAEVLEHAARVLLGRYGVVFRALLAREPGAPRWRDLLRVLRRLEARGEIRGGRFVGGFSGEQFALPEAVGALRAVRGQPARGELVTISAADPLNLTGIITPGARVPALASARLVLRDGLPVAVAGGDGEIRMLSQLGERETFDARAALGAPLAAPLVSGTLQ